MNRPLRTTLPARLAVGVTVMVALSACGTSTSDEVAPVPAPSSSTNTATATPEPSPPETTEPVRVIPYAGGESSGTEVLMRADAQKLEGAPEPFKEFIGTLAEDLTTKSTCDDGYVGVTVKALRTDGYATGAINDCGGYVALWATVDGQWQEIDDTQDLWDCKALTTYKVPSEIAGDTCFDTATRKQRDYQQD